MGLGDLWNRVRGVGNLTKDWTRDTRMKLAIDFDALSFCGVKLGEPIELLSSLGPSGNAHQEDASIFDYPDRGFAVGAADGKLVDITAFVTKDAKRRPFGGEFLKSGEAIKLTPETPADEIRSIFGEPTGRAAGDTGESILFYGRKVAEWVFSWEGKLLVSVELLRQLEYTDASGRPKKGSS